MRKWLSILFPPTPKERHADEKREQTHQAINDLQRSILAYQHKSRRDKAKIIKILSDSDEELNSVAQKIATATGAPHRGYKR